MLIFQYIPVFQYPPLKTESKIGWDILQFFFSSAHQFSLPGSKVMSAEYERMPSDADVAVDVDDDKVSAGIITIYANANGNYVYMVSDRLSHVWISAKGIFRLLRILHICAIVFQRSLLCYSFVFPSLMKSIFHLTFFSNSHKIYRMLLRWYF